MRKVVIIAGIAAVLLGTGAAYAMQDAAALRASGAAAEKADGYLAATSGASASQRDQVAAINIQRRQLFTNLAQQRGATIEEVAAATACQIFANRIAPEHLELAVADPEALLGGIRNAGAVFLGRYTPEAIGDYVAGPNHVLPTARSARFSSGLSVFDFLKRTTLLGLGPDQLRALADPAITLAEAEGLDAHARSVAIRLNR